MDASVNKELVEDYFTDQLKNEALFVDDDGGETIETQGAKVTFKLTSEISRDQLGIYQISLAPKTLGAKLHYHRYMDETFMVKEGELTVFEGTTARKRVLKEGSLAYFPRLTPHGFENNSENTVVLYLIFTPSSKREGFFKGLSKLLTEHTLNDEMFLKLYHKYDSYPVNV